MLTGTGDAEPNESGESGDASDAETGDAALAALGAALGAALIAALGAAPGAARDGKTADFRLRLGKISHGLQVTGYILEGISKKFPF